MTVSIFLSAKDDRNAELPRHVVVRIPVTADMRYRPLLQRVIGGRTTLLREVDRRAGRVTYRFHMKFLDRLLLAFPMADLSRGLVKRQLRIGRREIEQMEVPELDLVGFQAHDFVTRREVDLYAFQKIAVGLGSEALIGQRGTAGEDTEGNTIYSFLNNDSMGLGKTNMALATMCDSRVADRVFTILVVCPNNAKTVWQRHVQLNTDLECLVASGTWAEREAIIAQRAEVTIVNFQTIRAKWDKKNPETGRQYEDPADWSFLPNHPSLFEQEYDLVVVDEYHRVKNTQAQQTIGYLNIKSDRWMPMSGTPILSRPEEAWPTLHRCWPDRFPSESDFLNRIATRDGKDIVGYDFEYMAELREFLGENSIRRRKEQVMDQLPETVVATHWVELTSEQRRIYNQIRDEFLLEMDNGEKKSITDIRVQIGRLKQAAFSPELFGGSDHSAKLEELQDIVRELLAAGEKSIIFSQWKRATRIIQRVFEDVPHAYVDGTVTDRPTDMARTREQDRFNQDDECRLYIGTIAANQESISLGAATYVIFTDKAWTPAENNQAADRSASGGLRGLHAATTTVTRVELVAKDTIEEYLEEDLAQRTSVFNAMVERDGGARVTRTTLNDIRELVRRG